MRLARGCVLALFVAVATAAEESGKTGEIPAGFESFAFDLDAGGSAGDITRGSYVDLILVRAKGKGSVATMLVQNAYVLEVDAATNDCERPTIKVMVTPDDADRLAKALESGERLRLALRSLWEGDTRVVTAAPIEAPRPLRPLPPACAAMP